MRSYVIEFVFNLIAVEICQVWFNEDGRFVAFGGEQEVPLGRIR